MLFIEGGSIPHSFVNSFKLFKTNSNLKSKKRDGNNQIPSKSIEKSGELIVFIVNKKTHNSFMTLPKHL